jgi:nucleoid DNA-binding protein
MIIPSLIRALLEENSVTISGFGTFSVKKVSAQIKEDIIFPPQNIIEFEYSESVEGFDFVSKLSKWEQIRIDEAQAEVSKWLEMLQNGLEHNPTIFFEDFGTFSKNLLGKIVFQSVINSKLNIENEGYEPAILPSKIQKEIFKPVIEPVRDKRKIMAVRKKAKRDHIYFISIIVAAAVVLGVLFFKEILKGFIKTPSVKTETLVAVIEDESENVAYINSKIEIKSNEIPVVKTIKKDTLCVSAPLQDSSPYLSYQKGKYYVIAGSFVKEEDALRHIKNEKLDKYQPKLVVHPDSPRIRVSIGTFDNEKDAEKFADQFKKNYWVLK